MKISHDDTLRPCYIDGIKAMFHRFSECSEIIKPSPMIGGHKGGILRWAVAIVEYENGIVSEVEVTKVRFADGGNFKDVRFIPLEILDGGDDNG